MKKIIILMILILFISINLCTAQFVMKVVANKNIISKDEEIEINIELSNVNVATFSLEIYWDNTKLEYIKGPENSNKVNDRVLYTWVSDNGQNISEIKIGSFKFKGLENGETNLVVTGEFYNSEGEKVEISDSNIEIQISEPEEKIIENKNLNVSDDDVNLKILRLNHEGISPDFDKDIKEYYFVADDTIDSLEVTAVPENEQANIKISGNDNLKMGLNVINIEVQSKDKSRVAEYKIYITKTKNVEMANANLENLAIRQSALNPEFDFNVTRYYSEVANDIEKLDILAVPQMQNAMVKIERDDELKIGDNKIEVVVFAQDGITTKKYEIIVHRRNEVEEFQTEQEQNVQAEKLSAILDEIQNENFQDIEKEENNNGIFIIVLIIGSIIIMLSLVLIITKKRSINRQ